MASGDGGGARASACASRLWTGTPGIIPVRSEYESAATPIATVRPAEGEPPIAGARSAVSEENPSATARSLANRARLAVTTISSPTSARPEQSFSAGAGEHKRLSLSHARNIKLRSASRARAVLNSGSCQYLLKRNLNTPYAVKNSARRPSSSSPITGNTRLIIVAGGYRPRWKPGPRLRYNHR
jgi:hypothetical protein